MNRALTIVGWVRGFSTCHFNAQVRNVSGLRGNVILSALTTLLFCFLLQGHLLQATRIMDSLLWLGILYPGQMKNSSRNKILLELLKCGPQKTPES